MGEKGSPGSTTSALALATFSDEPAYMVEADAFGGDLSFRCRHAGLPLPESPTVLTAASAVRHGPADEVLVRYSHELRAGLRVVPGHLAAEQSFSTDWDVLATALAGSRHPIYVDLGRVHSASPTLGLAVRADVVIPVLRPDVTSVMRMLDRMNRLVPELARKRDSAPAVLPVVIVPARHAATVVPEVWELFAGSGIAPAVQGVAWLADDEIAATALYGGRVHQRSRLLTTARETNTQLRQIADPANAARVDQVVETRRVRA